MGFWRHTFVGGYHIIHSGSRGRGVHRLSACAMVKDLPMPDFSVSVRTTLYIVCRCEKLPCSTIFCEARKSSSSNCVTAYVAVSHLNLVHPFRVFVWYIISFECTLDQTNNLFGHLNFMKGAYSGETLGLVYILILRTTWKKLNLVAKHDFLRYKCEVHALAQVFHFWYHVEHNIVK